MPASPADSALYSRLPDDAETEKNGVPLSARRRDAQGSAGAGARAVPAWRAISQDTLAPCVFEMCEVLSGREAVGSLVANPVFRLGSRPPSHSHPEQLIEAAATDLAAQGQAP